MLEHPADHSRTAMEMGAAGYAIKPVARDYGKVTTPAAAASPAPMPEPVPVAAH